MQWKNININKNNIQAETENSMLIGMPKLSGYKGYSFWHPAKCIHDSFTNGYISLGYTDEWEFKLKKYGKGKYNKYQVIDEITVGAEEIENAFRNMNDQACSNKIQKVNPFETYKPEKLKPEHTEALQELIDD